MTHYEEFINTTIKELSDMGVPLTKNEMSLCKMVWEIAECAAFEKAESVAYEYYKLGLDSRDVAAEMSRLAKGKYA